MTPVPQTKGMSEDGWFTEDEVLWPGQRFSLKVDKVLLDKQTGFQHLQVFDSSTYGKVLTLDGVIQLTERDEFAYQEMMVHTPLMAHVNPKSVCIIGGGDGGVLREVARHSCVERIVMCEIDQAVCDASKEFFSTTMATSFSDPRLELLFADGAKFLRESGEKFDIIIVDSSDPVGPAETLFEDAFSVAIRGALNPGGISCVQGECMWLHLDIIGQLVANSRRRFSSVRYGVVTIPTYPSGQIGFVLSAVSEETDLALPARSLPDALQNQLRYYTPATHEASFVLPAFATRAIKDSQTWGLMPRPSSHNTFSLKLHFKQVAGVTAVAGFALGLAIGMAMRR